VALLFFLSHPLMGAIIGMMNGMMTQKVEEHKQHRHTIQPTIQGRQYQNQAAMVMSVL
jgi:hypothetical protein